MLRDASILFVAAACLQFVARAGEERTWEIQGEYVSLKRDNPGVVVLRISDALIEIPLKAFDSSSRTAIEKLSGRENVPTAAAAPLSKVLADDLASCPTAAEASDLCTLALADPGLPVEVRGDLEQRRKDFEARAVRGEVRFGEEWASPEVVREAAAKAREHLATAAEMMKLGNPKLVEEELQKAQRVDPSSGQADFLIGLAFMLRNRPDYEKALVSFEEVIRRQPGCGPAWNNIGVCKARQRDYSEALEAFRTSGRDVASRGAAVANLAVLITFAADRRSRISDRELEQIRALYQELGKDQGGAAAANGGLVVLSAGGAPVMVGAMNDLSSLLAPPPAAASSDSPELMGLVVGASAVLCSLPQGVTSVRDGLAVVTHDGRNLPAQRVATSTDGSLLLLKCEGLGVSPLPLAASTPMPGAPATVCTPTIGAVQSGAEAAMAAKFVTKSTGSTERLRCVVDVSGLSEAAGFGPGVVVLDGAGRLAGLGIRQPPSRWHSSSRRLFVPVDVVWRLLKQLDDSLGPEKDQSADQQLALAEAATRCRAAVVLVLTGQPIVTKP